MAVLGVLKTGAAYVPIDAAHPRERIGFVLADAAPVVAVCTAGLGSRVGDVVPVIEVDDPAVGVQPVTAPGVVAAGEVAYVMYTSGTTGVPKGVAVTHANVTRLIGSLDERLPKAGVWPWCHSLAFDVSVWEIFGALLRGGRLVVVPEAVAGSPEEFHALLTAEAGQRVDADPVGVGGVAGPRGWKTPRWWQSVRRVRCRWWIGGRRGG